MALERNRGGSGRSQRSYSNEVRYEPVQPLGVKIKNCCRSTIAFVFSNVGVCGLMVGYTIMGSTLFTTIEGEHEATILPYNPDGCRVNVSNNIWNYTLMYNNFDESSWRNNVETELKSYKNCIQQLLKDGWDGKQPNNTKWSFEGGFLYSLTVITTIGYGHICPVTDMGKIVTIIYTIFGMPVFLLYMANMGDILAKSLKWTYAKVCICTKSTPQYYPSDAWRSAEVVLRGPIDPNYLPPHYGNRFTRDPEEYDMREIPSISSSVDRSMGIRPPCLRKQYDQDDADFEYSSQEDHASYESQESYRDKIDPLSLNIPIKVSLVIMLALLTGGTFLFKAETWDPLSTFYFCFISLTTIGFGDYVPGKSINGNDSQDRKDFIYCSLYLMFGLAILSMCFNLMQEKLVSRVNSCMKKLSLNKEKEPD